MTKGQGNKNPVVKKVLDKVQRVVVGPKPADPDAELKKLTERGEQS